jgi:hypothetical protein
MAGVLFTHRIFLFCFLSVLAGLLFLQLEEADVADVEEEQTTAVGGGTDPGASSDNTFLQDSLNRLHRLQLKERDDVHALQTLQDQVDMLSEQLNKEEGQIQGLRKQTDKQQAINSDLEKKLAALTVTMPITAKPSTRPTEAKKALSTSQIIQSSASAGNFSFYRNEGQILNIQRCNEISSLIRPITSQKPNLKLTEDKRKEQIRTICRHSVTEWVPQSKVQHQQRHVVVVLRGESSRDYFQLGSRSSCCNSGFKRQQNRIKEHNELFAAIEALGYKVHVLGVTYPCWDDSSRTAKNMELLTQGYRPQFERLCAFKHHQSSQMLVRNMLASWSSSDYM